jgi:hypothetical protein
MTRHLSRSHSHLAMAIPVLLLLVASTILLFLTSFSALFIPSIYYLRVESTTGMGVWRLGTFGTCLGRARGRCSSSHVGVSGHSKFTVVISRPLDEEQQR